MQFSFLLAVLAALVIAENCPPQPVDGVAWRVAAAGGCSLVTVLVAWAISLVSALRLEDGTGDRQTALARFSQWRLVHTCLWIVMALAVILGLDWARIVRFNWRTDRLFLIDDLLVLTPVILPLVLSWVAFFRVDLAAYRSRSEPAAAAPSLGPYMSVHLRHYLGVMLLPILALLAVQDATKIWFPEILHTRWSAALYALPILLVLIFFPSLLRRLWKTVSLPDGDLRDRLEAAAARLGFRIRQILVWETGCMVVNAAVSGWVPGRRYVFLSDGLIASLTDEEIEAVFGHELGHIRHRHLLLRGLVMLAPLSLLLAFEQAQPDLATRIEAALAHFDTSTQLPWALGLLAALSSYAFFVFGGYCRMLEAQADLFGCGLLKRDDPRQASEIFISALEKIAAANGAGRRRTGWQHPSIARRTEFLARAADDPDLQRRFERRVRLLNGLLLAVILSPALVALLP